PAYRPQQIAGIDLTNAREIAKGLLDAQNPRIEVRRLRTAQGARLSVEIAELVGASAGTGATTGPMSFPQRHPLCGPGSSTAYDYTLGLEIPAAQASIIGPGLATLLERDSANIGFGGIAPAAGGRGARGCAGAHHVQLWDHNKPHSYLGGQGAGGMGYGAPASVGAALAAKSRNRIVINIQCDGDLNYAPGVLWTAVHHKLPLLTIMHNNRAWHQELMFVEYMCGVRGRGTDRGHIGTSLRDPFIDYAKMAAGYGMASEGPISDPAKLAGAFKRGLDSAKRGEPYLIDVITQPR